MFKTKLYGMLMALMLIGASLSFSACSSDDDDSPSGGSGNPSITVDGKTIKFKYAGYMSGYDEDGYYFGIVFSDFNPESSSMPKKANALVIDLYGGDGKELPTGTFQPGQYDLTLMVDWDMYTEESGLYYEEYERLSGPLTISKDGGKYTISLPKMGLELCFDNGEEVAGDGVFTTSSFEYTGSLKYYSKIDYE